MYMIMTVDHENNKLNYNIAIVMRGPRDYKKIETWERMDPDAIRGTQKGSPSDQWK